MTVLLSAKSSVGTPMRFFITHSDQTLLLGDGLLLEKAMNIPIKHHYLSISYQNGFVDAADGKISFINLKSGERKRGFPINLAKEKYLYTMTSPPLGSSPTFIECPTLSNIDGSFPGLREKLLAGGISSTERMDLSIFVAHLRARVPFYFELIKEVGSELMIKKLYEIFSGDSELLARAKEAEFDMTSLASFSEDASPILFQNYEKDLVLSTFLNVARELSKFVNDLNWDVLIADQGSFITSDRPFCKAWDEFVHVDQGRSESFKYFIVPLSSNLCLRMSGSGGACTRINFGLKEVEEINSTIAYCAGGWLFGESHDILERAHAGAVKLKRIEAIDEILSHMTR